MGNCIVLHCQGKKRNEFKHQRLDLIGTDCSPAHQGIKTVRVEKACNFSTGSVLCVHIITWNMNGMVSIEDLAKLVGRDRKFDLLAVGLQEVPKSNVARLLESALGETHREIPLYGLSIRTIQMCFQTVSMQTFEETHFAYFQSSSLLGEVTMQSLQLFVFGPKNSQLHTQEIKVDKHAVGGCGGWIGRKKGAVAIYINFNGIRMVFVSCHLSAHARNVQQRNLQCRHISHSLFSKDRNPYARPSHVTVWLGDLNYRIEGIRTLPARTLIYNNLHKMLTSKDQLLQEAERGHIFNGYSEGTLSFKPTYKYNNGSSIYDTSYKIRVPSWTDRILFKVDTNSGIEAALHSYESIDCINSSDHKPVRAHLCLKVNDAQMHPLSYAAKASQLMRTQRTQKKMPTCVKSTL